MWGTQYPKLKTNLKLAANRLKLLQKKKTELGQKARTEIPDRARIRVESIIREDFLVEAYELLEMYCETLHTRFGVIQQMKEPDDSIAEAVISLLWVAPRIAHEVPEFKVISDQLTLKYGKPFAEAARMNQLTEPAKVAPKLVQKLSVSAPSKLLVEKYLIAICRCANVPFEPDEKVMREDDDEIALAERNLNNFVSDEPIPSKGDGIGWMHDSSILDQLPQAPTNNINHPPGGGNNSGGGGGGTAVPFNYPSLNPGTPQAPPPQNSAHMPPPTHMAPTFPPQQISPNLPPTHMASQLPPTNMAPSHPIQNSHPQQKGPVFPHPDCGAAHMPIFNAPMPPPQNEYTPYNPKSSAPDPDHIYEVPPGNFDFDFPMPPSDDVSNFKPTPGEPTNPGDAIDDLARRFEELKKRT
uniref:IST1 homolog n=1 Tax=Panagrolaimus sp. ES5 TaxID=591445 RepID=A0AC34G1W0_9BILA